MSLVWKEFEAGMHPIKKTAHFYDLTITEGAQLLAPKGKALTLIVNGVVKPIEPCHYVGDIELSVNDLYDMPPQGLNKMTQSHRFMNVAVAVKDNEIIPGCSVLDAVNGGEVTGTGAKDIYIAATSNDFNGILVTGDSEYTIDNARIYFEGDGRDDFVGVGAGVAATDNAHVVINNSEIRLNSVTRCAVHSGGDSVIELNNCRLSNMSPDTDRLRGFSWQLGVTGSNRLTQLIDNGKIVFNNCDVSTNGWGTLSIDGSEKHVEYYMKDSRLSLAGPRARGYGAFCIGENSITFDNTDVQVDGFPMLVMGLQGLGRPSFINGTKVTGRHFGAMIINDDNSIFTMKDSSVTTGRSSIVIKSSATRFDIDNMEFNPGNGVVLQLQDGEEMGMGYMDYKIPVGIKDTYTPDRDLFTATELSDVILNISNSDITGNFFNSTTDLRFAANATKGNVPNKCKAGPEYPEGFTPPDPWDDDEVHHSVNSLVAPVLKRHNGDDLRGAKNLGMDLVSTRITGIISSAVSKYRDGLFCINYQNNHELSNITQTAAPTVNNGVVLSLDGKSEWVVTGTSYVTSLTLSEGAKLSAPEGKTLTMTVDGVATEIAPGKYEGKIVLAV